MKKKILLVSVLVAAVVLCTAGFFALAKKPAPDPYVHAQMILGGTVFDALVSNTPALQEQGLSGLSGLAENQVMLFVFDEPQNLTFWMRDMLFSIDMIWLNENYRIVGIVKSASPSSYPKLFSPNKNAQYVIEANAGTADRLGLKEGDEVIVSYGI